MSDYTPSTDDLLDEATRLADVAPPGSAAEQILATPRVLRALVQRVQAAEAERQEWADLWQQTSMSVLRLMGERDAARGKLDKVRRLIDEWGKEPGFASLRAEALAILDGKETK